MEFYEKSIIRFSSWKSMESTWQGDSNGNVFNNKEDAIRNAKALVASLPEGTCSEIRVQKADGSFQTEWTYGKDPFSPRG